MLEKEIYVLDPEIKVVGSPTPTSKRLAYLVTGKFEVVVEDDNKPPIQIWSKIGGDGRIDAKKVKKIIKALEKL